MLKKLRNLFFKKNYSVLKHTGSLLLSAVMLFFVGCNSTDLKSASDTTMPQNVRQIFSDKCTQCHLGTSTGSLFTFGLDTQKMIQAELVKPGNPDESPLYQKLTSTPPYGSRMPKTGAYLSNSELTVISDWITNLNVTPTLEITTPLTNSYIDSLNNSAIFVVSGSCNINQGLISIYVDGTIVKSDIVCGGASFSTTISTTGLSEAAHVFTATMTIPSSTTTKDSSAITVTKNTSALSIQITSQSNLSTSKRSVTATDTSLITANSASYVISGSCNANGRQVTILLDSVSIATTTCSAGSFSVTVDNTSWTSAAATPSKISGAHKLTAKLDNLGGSDIESNIYVFKSISPVVSFSTDIIPLLTIPRAGNSKACIDCHYTKVSGLAGSASFTLGYWADCPSGGKPNGAGGCSNTNTVATNSSLRNTFVFQLGYYNYTSTTPASNGSDYTLGLTIVNDKPENSNWVSNRIVRGNPEQSFIYRKVASATPLCYNSLLLTDPTLSAPVNCKTDISVAGAQMPVAGPTYFTDAENLLVYKWIVEGARTDN